MLPSLLSSHAEDDPSLKPTYEQDSNTKYAERYRVLTDLDGDGVQDLILSIGMKLFGNGGGFWKVYLKRDKEFVPIGDIEAHPLALSFEPDRERNMTEPSMRHYARIWFYSHGGAQSGVIGYYKVGPSSITPAVYFDVQMSENAIGSSIYKAVFDAPSPIPFKLQASTTDAQGHVSWQEYKR
jgi:hypothetical protein